jgi:predicted secreted Zn-dependent protease
MKKTLTLQEQANEVLLQAQERGVSTNFFFATTFKRYQVQMKILTDLERKIAEDGPLVTKEYVKNRGNVYVNPAITEYNKTATAANGTVATLINIIKSFTEEGATAGSKFQSMMDQLNAIEG